MDDGATAASNHFHGQSRRGWSERDNVRQENANAVTLGATLATSSKKVEYSSKGALLVAVVMLDNGLKNPPTAANDASLGLVEAHERRQHRPVLVGLPNWVCKLFAAAVVAASQLPRRTWIGALRSTLC